jgi:hypothetical protein
MKKLVFILLLAVLALGCAKSTTMPVVDTVTAQKETDLGNQALVNGDFATANAHYRTAVSLNPDNTQAQFGAGVTEVFQLQSDPEVVSLQNQLSLTRTRSATQATSLSRTERATALSLRLTEAGQGVDPRYAPQSMGKAFFRTLLHACDDPRSISEIQRIIRRKIMPQLQFAEDRLNRVEAASNFTLLLPPSITGLPQTIEIDKTEVYVLDAVVNDLQGWLGILVAYNFDVPNNDFEHVNAESLLAAGTAWATLHRGGAQQLASARLDFLNVKIKLDAAAAYLAAETDDQSDDVIPASWLKTQAYLDLRDAVNRVDNSLKGPVTTTVNDASQQPMTLQVYIGRFFVPAIADLKTKFPALEFTAGHPVVAAPITFSDPTINGIFPDMTNPRWQQLTGITGGIGLRSHALSAR